MKNYYGEGKYITAWGYFWLNVLFCIPVIGFISLIICSFSKRNTNLRNYARSFFVTILAIIVIWIVMVIATLALGISFGDPIVEYEQFIQNVITPV